MFKIIRTVLGVTAAAAILVLLAGFLTNAAHASTTVTGTGAQDNAACAAVYHYHHIAAHYDGNSDAWVAMANRAWEHAWHLAGYADQLPGDSMRHNIRRYLRTGRGWSLVAYDCNPDA